MLRKNTLLLISSSVIRARTKNKKRRETSSALFYFSLAACHYLSTSYFTYCHLLPSPCHSAQRCNHIYSVMKMKSHPPSASSSSTHSHLSLVESGHPFVVVGTNKLFLLTQSRQEWSLEWNLTESRRSKTGGLWLSEISEVNGYACLSLCVFTAVISALCCG